MQIPEGISGKKVTPRGVHLMPSGLHNIWMENADYWLSLLVDMGMSWCLALSESDNILLSGAAEALLSAGIIPIIRFNYDLPRPWTHGDVTEQLVDLYAQYGAPLVVQFSNEPMDPREWVDGNVPPYEEAWNIIVQRWHEMANITTQRGAYPGFPDGPGYDENPFLRVGDENLHWQEGRAVYLGHHYGKGRPLDYPEDDVTKYGIPLTMNEYLEQLDDFVDDPAWNEGEAALELMNQQRVEWADPNLTPLEDDTCWRGWEKIAWWSEQAFGFQVQQAMTEGGWTPRDRAGSNPIDIRWPYTTPKMVAKKTLAMYESGSPLFALCPWLVASRHMGASGWYGDCWAGGAYSNRYGFEKPVIGMLKANPPNGNAIQYVNTAKGEVESAQTNLLAAIEALS